MLVDKIKADIKHYRLQRNKIYVNSLQSIIAECDRKGKDIDDNQVLKVLKQSIENLNQCNTVKPSDEYVLEINLLKQYIPKQMTEEELYIILHKQYNSGITEIRDLMKYLKDNYQGKYDGKLANSIIQNLNKS